MHKEELMKYLAASSIEKVIESLDQLEEKEQLVYMHNLLAGIHDLVQALKDDNDSK